VAISDELSSIGLNLLILCRAVARSEIPGGLEVLGGDNVFLLVEIGLNS
jgi:hypothetical protein